MGSHDYTCSVSGLPIQAGTDVRYLLLTENPFYGPGASTCYLHDVWVPRTFPLKAKYNDYGGVEELEQGFNFDLWIEGLKLDLIEQGVGDNVAHDVATSPDMDAEELVDALREGRVLVKGLEPEEKQVERIRSLMPGRQRELHEGIPTMKRVSDIIAGVPGMKLSDDGYRSEGYLVDTLPNKFVRVRWAPFGEKVLPLARLQAHLGQFATLITTGTGGYNDSAELLVAPKPLPEGEHYGMVFRPDISKDLVVAQTMIREDVWQTILGMRFEFWAKEYPPDYPSWRELADKFWEQAKTLADATPLLRELGMSTLQGYQGNIVAGFTKDEAFITGLGSHFEIALKKGPTGEELERFLDSVAEMAFVQFILGNLRFQWRSGTICGPQCGEWALHKEFLTKLADQVVVPDEDF